ncbi:MAG: substrate-binding domain-containing protein, partial [Bacteroidota bacterium]
EYIHEAPGGEPETGLAALGHFLKLQERPTAYVCYNDLMAIGLLKGLQESGIRVPQEASVAGFDNIKYSAHTNPALTTLDQPKRFIGEEAARLLLELLESPAPGELRAEPEIRILKGSLLVRESTAPPPHY